MYTRGVDPIQQLAHDLETHGVASFEWVVAHPDDAAVARAWRASRRGDDHLGALAQVDLRVAIALLVEYVQKLNTKRTSGSGGLEGWVDAGVAALRCWIAGGPVPDAKLSYPPHAASYSPQVVLVTTAVSALWLTPRARVTKLRSAWLWFTPSFLRMLHARPPTFAQLTARAT